MCPVRSVTYVSGRSSHRINPQFTEPFGDGASSVQVPSFSPSASIALTCVAMPAPKSLMRQFIVGDKIRVSLHHGKIEDAVVLAVIQDDDGLKLQVDVVGLGLTALIDTWQAVE
jgi:hypothetical protein